MKTRTATEKGDTLRHRVINVDRKGATIESDGQSMCVSWGDLAAAAAQEDRSLSAVYSRLLGSARQMAADGPVDISVHQDYTNVWWVCTVSAVNGGGPANYSQYRDEGGTHPHAKLAIWEALRICERLGSRVYSRNF